MEEILNEKYLKLLELVEKIDKKLVDKIYSIIKSLPRPVKNYIKKEQSCELNGTDSSIDLSICDDVLDLQYVRYKNYLDTIIFVCPFYETDLEIEIEEDDEGEDFHHLLICSLTQTNTEEECFVKLYYEQIGDKYKFKDMEIPNNGKEVDMSVYLDKIDGEFYLTCVKTFNGIEISRKQENICYYDLLDFACKYDDNNLDEEI